MGGAIPRRLPANRATQQIKNLRCVPRSENKNDPRRFERQSWEETMKRSVDRILTTHVGSLPRPDDLFEMMLARMDGTAVDEKAYAERVRLAVKDSVKQQVDAGLDVVSDGEMGKPSFITYAAQRLDGLETRQGTRPSPFSN